MMPTTINVFPQTLNVFLLSFLAATPPPPSINKTTPVTKDITIRKVSIFNSELK